MSPNSKPTDHALGTWWRRWAGSIALLAIVVGGTLGFIKVENTAHDTNKVAKESAVTAGKLADVVRRLDDESKVREEQFCQLVLNTFEDRVTRLRNTEEFLRTPAGQEGTALNIYIREISLPQTIIEVEKEREGIPDICWKYKPSGTP